jgi:hypothetical protein
MPLLDILTLRVIRELADARTFARGKACDTHAFRARER